MSNVSRRFVVLSQGINTSDDVFNNLVEVQDKQTGEMGTLLCSHMCQWPEELINQATWLEGCKTPELFKDESRLALGYHPEQYTQWKVFKETNEIEIYLTGHWGNEENEVEQDETIYFHVGLPYVSRTFPHRAGEFPSIPEALFRLCRRVVSNLSQESINNLESLIHRLFNSGRIDGWTASVLGRYILWEEEGIEFHWEGTQDMFLPEGSQTFFNTRGYYFASCEEIPIKYSHFLKQWEVIRDVPDHFAKAIEFPTYHDNEDNEIVWYINPDKVEDYLTYAEE